MIFDAIRESHDLQRDLCRKLTASRGGRLQFVEAAVQGIKLGGAERPVRKRRNSSH